jgi:hypothetical protein
MVEIEKKRGRELARGAGRVVKREIDRGGWRRKNQYSENDANFEDSNSQRLLESSFVEAAQIPFALLEST